MNNNSIFQNQLLEQYKLFKTNPINFLLSKNINIPQEYMNDPKAAVDYLVKTGRISPETMNKMQDMASKINLNQ